jgi:hypothetical protein
MIAFRKAAWVPLAMLALAAPAAQAQVKLQFKFPENQRFRVQEKTLIDQTLTINGMEVPTKSEQSSRGLVAIGAKRDDGSVPVVRTIEAVRSEVELPGGQTLTFDSDDKAEAPEGEVPQLKQAREVIKALGGANYTIIIDKDGKVAGIEGAERAVPKADSLDPEVADLIKKRFSVERLKKDSQEEYGLFPDILLREGEPWERSETMDLGGSQTMTFQRKYEYQGTVEEKGRTLDKIGVKATAVSYRMEPSPAVPVSVSKSDLKIESSDGTILFDREEGRIVRSKIKTRITGDMTLEAGGMELPTKLDLSIDTETVVDQAVP